MKILLLLLTFFTGFTALVSGVLLTTDPTGKLIGMSEKLLEPSPFSNFLIPGLLLATFVGIFNLMAGYMLVRDNKRMYDWTLLGGFIVAVWILVQVIMIETIFWLQFLYLGIGLSMIVLLSYQLKKKWLV